MKKKILLAIQVMLVLSICYAQKKNNPQKFLINGRIDDQDTGYCVLSYINGFGKFVRDTSPTIKGNFSFKGQISEITFSGLSSNFKPNNEASLFLEPGVISIQLQNQDFRNTHTKGSSTQVKYEELRAAEKEILDSIEFLYHVNVDRRKQFKIAKDSSLLPAIESASQQIDVLRDKKKKIECAFIVNNPGSYVSAYLMQLYAQELPIDSARLLYNGLSQAVKKGRMGLFVKKIINRMASTIEGETANDFTTTDIKGKRISLSSLKGKQYVLLDFWASWCKPCRIGSPHLRKVFSAYENKGLSIISISLDSDEKAWRIAVKQDSLDQWTHVLATPKQQSKTKAGLALNDDIMEKFDVPSIPFMLLINKNGKIVKKIEGYSEEMEKFLDKSLEELINSNPS